jgi:transcriptional regulator of aromatic amino acid metabolism
MSTRCITACRHADLLRLSSGLRGPSRPEAKYVRQQVNALCDFDAPNAAPERAHCRLRPAKVQAPIASLTDTAPDCTALVTWLLLTGASANEQQNAALARALESATARYGIIGTSPRLLSAISELERVSDSAASVLLLGESGTGKELFARALHLASPRRDKAFIKINCAAIPDALFESELSPPAHKPI